MTSLKRHFLKNFPTKFDKIFRQGVKLMSHMYWKFGGDILRSSKVIANIREGGAESAPPPAGRGLNVRTSITSLQYPTCERVWRLSTFSIVNMPPHGTSQDTSLPSSTLSQSLLFPTITPPITTRSFKSYQRGRDEIHVARPSSLWYDGHNLPP